MQHQLAEQVNGRDDGTLVYRICWISILNSYLYTRCSYALDEIKSIF